MLERMVDLDKCCSALQRIGIPITAEIVSLDIDFCRIAEVNGTPAYYRRFGIDGEGGASARHSPRPLGLISSAMLRDDANDPTLVRNCLIGFWHSQDGTIRRDVLQVIDDILGNPLLQRLPIPRQNWPTHVMFWKDHVPMSRRAGLAVYMGPFDRRIIV